MVVAKSLDTGVACGVLRSGASSDAERIRFASEDAGSSDFAIALHFKKIHFCGKIEVTEPYLVAYGSSYLISYPL